MPRACAWTDRLLPLGTEPPFSGDAAADQVHRSPQGRLHPGHWRGRRLPGLQLQCSGGRHRQVRWSHWAARTVQSLTALGAPQGCAQADLLPESTPPPRLALRQMI